MSCSSPAPSPATACARWSTSASAATRTRARWRCSSRAPSGSRRRADHPGVPWQVLPYERQLRDQARAGGRGAAADRAAGRLRAASRSCRRSQQWRYRNKLEYSFGDERGAASWCAAFTPPAGGKRGRADRGLPAGLRARQPRARGRAALVPRAGLTAWERGSAARRGTRRARTRADGACADGRARLRNLVVREGRRTGKLQVRLVTTDGELDAGSLARGAERRARASALSGVLWTRSRSLAETTAGGETELVWGEAELPERLGRARPADLPRGVLSDQHRDGRGAVRGRRRVRGAGGLGARV